MVVWLTPRYREAHFETKGWVVVEEPGWAWEGWAIMSVMVWVWWWWFLGVDSVRRVEMGWVGGCGRRVTLTVLGDAFWELQGEMFALAGAANHMSLGTRRSRGAMHFCSVFCAMYGPK